MGGLMKNREKARWSIHVIQHVSGEGRRPQVQDLTEQSQRKGMCSSGWMGR